jgi:hypothetical protein
VRWALLLLWTSTYADQSPLAQSMTKGEYAAFEKRDTNSRILHEGRARREERRDLHLHLQVDTRKTKTSETQIQTRRK